MYSPARGFPPIRSLAIVLATLLEELLDHPPGPLPWRDDFVAWRKRTRTS